MGKRVVKFRLRGEIHCDACNEVAHNHIDKCPICGKEFAETDSYYDVGEVLAEDPSREIEVQCWGGCKTRFRLIKEPEDGFVPVYGQVTKWEVLDE